VVVTEPPNQSVDSRPARILVVDDTLDGRYVVTFMLRDAGYEVIEAANGREAMRHFEAAPTDIVVTDLYMPEEDGLELIAWLREFIPRVPVVAVSGGDRATLQAAGMLGADVILEKPLDPMTLVDVVRALLAASDA
jgi:CheY-like chemotaxis protein